MVLKSRPIVTMAGAKANIYEGRMAEWLRPLAFHCRERTEYTPDKRGFEILFLKEVHRLGGWC